MKRVNLFGISVDPLTTKQTVELVREKIVNKVPTHLLGMNADKVNGLGKDKQYDEIVKNADIINADGVSLIMAAKFLNKSIPERVAGIDLMQDLLEMAEKYGFSVYFLGAKHAVVSTLVDRMKG
ncbi:WecB/TagA/CpsF family glycosyltransferase, partial [Pediococcus acidilactici]|nr:WecB/TagA/CpsF family glycosyltransferase [Pediococcus acidilactici]